MRAARYLAHLNEAARDAASSRRRRCNDLMQMMDRAGAGRKYTLNLHYALGGPLRTLWSDSCRWLAAEKAVQLALHCFDGKLNGMLLICVQNLMKISLHVRSTCSCGHVAVCTNTADRPSFFFISHGQAGAVMCRSQTHDLQTAQRPRISWCFRHITFFVV